MLCVWTSPSPVAGRLGEELVVGRTADRCFFEGPSRLAAGSERPGRFTAGPFHRRGLALYPSAPPLGNTWGKWRPQQASDGLTVTTVGMGCHPAPSHGARGL